MAEQSYSSHRHQPIPTFVATALWLVAAIASLGGSLWDWHSQGIAMAALLGAVFAVVAIGRAYTTKLQDRIILLEMKVRCAEVLPAADDAVLKTLTTPQIIALRFASDAELPALAARAAREKLSPDDIKKAITQWTPDLLRT